MRTLQDAKKTYDETAIPSELSERIQMEIKKADRKRKKILFICYFYNSNSNISRIRVT